MRRRLNRLPLVRARKNFPSDAVKFVHQLVYLFFKSRNIFVFLLCSQYFIYQRNKWLLRFGRNLLDGNFYNVLAKPTKSAAFFYFSKHKKGGFNSLIPSIQVTNANFPRF
jgi:hypothetical protein